MNGWQASFPRVWQRERSETEKKDSRTETERDRKTGRQTGRQRTAAEMKGWQPSLLGASQRKRSETEKKTAGQRQTDRHAGGQAGRQTDRQAGRQAGRRTDREQCLLSSPTAASGRVQEVFEPVSPFVTPHVGCWWAGQCLK